MSPFTVTCRGKVLATILLFLAVCPACNKTPQVGGGNNQCEMVLFRFNSSDNDGLAINATAVRVMNDFFITVPEDTDLTRLVPAIMVSEGATAYIDNFQFEKGTQYDFSGDVQIIKVVSESGTRTNTFRLLVRKGISDIDNMVYSYMKKYGLPGVSISYAKNETISYTAAYGFSSRENSVRCTPGTLFRIADVSQALCAVCIMSCMDEGLLRLEDSPFAPGGILRSRVKSFILDCYDSIQIRHLLSHSSGLDDSSFDFSASSVDDLIRATLDNKELREALSNCPQGKKFCYSNMGYCILQAVLEEAYHMPYDDVLKMTMARAGISNIKVGNNTEDEFGQNECVYYQIGNDDPYSISVHELGGAVGVVATPRELTLLLTTIDGGTVVPDILHDESRIEMFSPFTYSHEKEGFSYGYGWSLQKTRYLEKAYYHNGTMYGSTAFCAILPEKGICGSLVCNAMFSHIYSNDEFNEETESLFASIADKVRTIF